MDNRNLPVADAEKTTVFIDEQTLTLDELEALGNGTEE